MKKTIITLCGVVAAVSGIAQVDSTATKLNEVIVTATSKHELQRKDSGKPVIKITRADIEQQAAASLADLLNQYAGLEINGSRSNAGQNLGLFIRGGNNRQVSVLIDGAQVSDASAIANDFDLRLINLDQVEEIEILKGAASTLYGANASTAVINIKLKPAARERFKVNVSSFMGTNTSSERAVNGIDEFQTDVYGSGSTSKGLTYALGFSHQSTDGLSAVESPDENTNFNSNPFNRVNLLGRIGYDNRKDFKLTSYVSFDEFKASFDDSFGFIDNTNETYNRQVRWGTNMSWKYNDRGEIVYNDVSTHTRRDTRSGFPSIFNADGYSLDLFNRYTFDLANDLELKTILGFNFRSDQYEDFSIPFGSTEFEQNADTDTANAQIYDPYANVVLVTDFGLNVNAGARYNLHSNYDGQFVYNLNPSYRFNVSNETSLKFYGSLSTAYIAPSLFQLYAAGFGNEDLNPEENQTLEVGVELVSEKSSLTISAFERDEQNLVIFTTIDPVNFISQYLNNDTKTTARGLEVTGLTKLFNDKLTLQANYSFTERDLVETDSGSPISPFRRIPRHKLNASARYQFLPTGFITARYQYNDTREDAFFNADTFATEVVNLDAFQTVDLDITYGLKKKPVVFFAGVSNLFNTEFQEIFGFQTRGRNFKIGTRFTL